jgi:hypothetical protein
MAGKRWANFQATLVTRNEDPCIKRGYAFREGAFREPYNKTKDVSMGVQQALA